jgi:dipeptidyl aminopeptidase/acylaminoacyl peptidase
MTGMLPEDVYALTGVADPRVSPDGATAAYVVTRVDGEANTYAGGIWLAPLEGAAQPRPFTAGTTRDAEPRWSPDGTLLAFTSDRDGDAMQLYVMPVAGGEPRRLTSRDEDVTQVAWSPDGTRLAFASRVRDAAYEEDDDKRRKPRRFTTLQYKLEHVGWTGDRRQHLFTVRADGSGEPVQITAGDFDDSAPAWSPDGTQLAFVAAREPDWDIRPVSDIYLVDAAGGAPRRLTQGGGACDTVSWSPDGTRLATLRSPGVFDDPRHTQVAVVDAASGELTLLTASLDRNCSPYPTVREPVWDGAELLFAVEDRGNVHIYRVAAGGASAPRLVVGGERTVTGFDASGGRLAYTATQPTRLAELYVDERRITHAGDGFLIGRELPAPERFTAVSRDGSEVDAWILRPAGFEQGTKYPALLNIHGGPFTQYGNRFFDEFQVYAAAGYVVLFCNPRGSSGYSEAWGRAIRGPGAAGPGWGSVDVEDCMATVDEALARFDFVDGERLGVMGGSYGGYLTSWIIGHSDRFKVAVSERAVNNFVSQWGSSDFGWDFKGYIGSFLFEDVPAYLQMSPATYAQDIHTPVLILHSEDDLRCPVEQAEQLFVTLRLLRRPVEMVRFPAESHELTRSGSPAHRVERFRVVLEWLDRHLKD